MGYSEENSRRKNELKKENSRYFQEALSDFMYDAASGRAVRHLVDDGYTSAQIMQRLDYPTPFAKIQKTVTKRLKETGMLLDELPVSGEQLKSVILGSVSEETLFSCLAQRISRNGEENAYISCPFGACAGADDGISKLLSPLTAREREYILGIAWESGVRYHRLDRRMLEIGVQLACRNPDVFSFYFLKSYENLRLE